MRGSPSERDGFTIRSTRRSEMFASSATASTRLSSAKATGWPWKLPFDTISRSSSEDERVVGRGVELDLDRAADVVEQVAARAVHLRGAAERVRVLHLVAPAVRLEDRRPLEQHAHVRGRRDLAGMRTRRVDRLVEARERALQRLERERAGDVGGPDEPAGAHERRARPSRT